MSVNINLPDGSLQKVAGSASVRQTVVTVTPSELEGEKVKIAEISVNGIPSTLYAPKGGGSADIDNLDNYVQLEDDGKISPSLIPNIDATNITETTNKKFVTDEEKNNWNNKAEITDIPIVPTKLSDLDSDDNHLLVTKEEKEKWDAGDSGLAPRVETLEGNFASISNYGTLEEFNNIKNTLPVGASFDITDDEVEATPLDWSDIENKPFNSIGNGLTVKNNVLIATGGGESSGGGTGVSDYDLLDNRPSINGVTLTGNKTTSELGINIPTDLSELNSDDNHMLVTKEEKTRWNSADSGLTDRVSANEENIEAISHFGTKAKFEEVKDTLPVGASFDITDDQNEGGGSSGSGGGSVVTVTQHQESGVHIADITIDGNTTEIYAPNGGGSGGGNSDLPANVWSGSLEDYEKDLADGKIANGTIIAIDDDDMAIGDLNAFFDVLNGGSEELVENKVYSEEEKLIGTFFGEPLYRKCFKGTYDTTSYISFPEFKNTTHTIVNTQISIFNSNHTQCVTNGYVNSNNYAGIYIDNTSLRLYKSNSFNSGDYILIVEYTKVGDEDVNS